MNLILRMIYVFVSSYFKEKLSIDKPINSLSLMVLPNDIDINLHMNNGRYLTICDLTRIDMFIRTGLAKTMMYEKWMPVISEHTMIYKKPLKLFKRYDVKMEIIGWDDRAFHMIHTFTIGDRVIAEGTSKGVIVGRGGVISPADVMKKVDEGFHKKNNR